MQLARTFELVENWELYMRFDYMKLKFELHLAHKKIPFYGLQCYCHTIDTEPW